MKPTIKNIVYPVGVILMLNVFMHGGFLIAIDRPMFYYEYLALPLLFTYLPNNKMRWAILSIIILGDGILSLSRFYFFDSFNYITKIPSLFFSHFSFSFWMILILGVFLFTSLIYFIIKGWYSIRSNKETKIFYTKFLLLFFLIVYAIDIKTGNSFFYYKTFGNNYNNFSQSIIYKYYSDGRIFVKKYYSIKEIKDFRNGSITYKYLHNDSSNHQILIVLESWGLINDASIRKEQIADLMQLKNKGYK